MNGSEYDPAQDAATQGKVNTPPALGALWNSPHTLRAVFENSPDLVLVVNCDRRILYVNRLRGSGRGILGVDACDLVAPEYRALTADAIGRAFATGVPASYEALGRGRDDRPAFFEARVTPIVVEGRIEAALISSADVTEKRHAERTQQAIYRISEAAQAAPSLQELFQAIHGIVGELMPAQNFYIALYDAASDIVSFPYFVDEYDPQPAPKRPGRGLTEYVLRTGETVLGTPEAVAEIERRGEAELIGAPSLDWLGVPLKTRAGTIGALVVQSYHAEVRYGEREMRVLGFVSSQIAMAIERKRAEEALRQSELTLQSIVDAIPETVLLLKPDGTILAANPSVLQGTGFEPEQVVGRSAYDFSARDLMPARKEKVEEAARTGQAATVEDTSAVTGRTHINFFRPVLGEDGTVASVVVVALDITERKRAEEALRRSEEQYRTLVDGARDVIFALSPEGVITALNPAFESKTGMLRSDWLGRHFSGLMHPDDALAARELFARFARGEPEVTGQLRFRSRDGGALVGELHANLQVLDGRVVGILGIVRDVTDRLRLEDQLRQAQKMEAVGRLAGGVAHDFNNLLTAIGGYSDLLIADLGAQDPRRGDVEEIKRASERAAALTRQLLAFSRRQVLQPTVLDLNGVVGGAEKLLRRLIGEDVTLVIDLAPDLGPVRADAGQLEQVIVNLAVNAREAMAGGGTLTVSTANVELSGTRTSGERSPMPPGDYVELTVSDTGAGMDEETQRHLFEPFFTTREVGKGTGLGLATVYGIVKQSDGFVWVESEPGRGTTFTIHLPRVDEEVEPVPRALREDATADGSETVLLVEDEPAVRAVARQALVRHGYRVLEAADATEALALAGAHPGGIALLLTDVVMPGLGGRALAERLSAGRPGLKVLYMSGYTENAIVRQGELEPGLDYLQKPFVPDALARRVREVLDRSA